MHLYDIKKYIALLELEGKALLAVGNYDLHAQTQSRIKAIHSWLERQKGIPQPQPTESK